MRGGLALIFVTMVVSAIISPAAMLTDPRKCICTLVHVTKGL
jgi:hypothetical protein